MRKHCFLALLLLFAAAAQSFGANFYLRKGATGSNSGTDWTNAWTEFNSINWGSVSCGDTIWIAGGTYTSSLSVNKTCTAGSVLNINRVQATDAVPAAAAGWNNSFDSQVIINNASISLAGGAYYTINGRINYGIQVVCTSSGGCNGVTGATSGSIDHVSLYHVELYGPACVMAENCGGGGASGLNVAPSSNKVTNLLFSRGFIHRWGELVRTSNWTNCTIEYSSLSDTHNDGPQHEDVMYNYPSTNMTLRYNKIWGSPNDGIFFEFGGATNFKFYGNIYYHSGGSLMTFKAGDSYGPVFIYNNIFENDGTFGDYQPGWLNFGGTMDPSSEIANNIFENVDNQASPSFSNHNAYNLGGYTEPGTFKYTSGTQFVNTSSGNPPAADFHLTAAGATSFAGKGKALAAEYNQDMDGHTRGADGGWDIGAYEYGGASTTPPPTPPAPPTNLTGVVQ